MNTKWPLASRVVFEEETEAIVRQFANANFDFLTDSADKEKMDKVRIALDSLQEE